jgi:hypothetical protein
MCISKIRKLEQSLETQEQYIKYLYVTIEGHESEIEDLRCKNWELRISLKDALSNISLKEEALQALERQLIEAENKNLELKDRISVILESVRTSRTDKNMAQANPVNFILNNYLPGIANILQQIRQHTERIVPLTRPNLDNRYDQINHYLDQIRQGVTPLLNATQNLANITAERNQYLVERAQYRTERDQYQNLLNAENRQVADLRNQLQNSRNQYLNSYWNLRVNWQLAQDRKTRISELLREKFAYMLLNHQKTRRLQHSQGWQQQTQARYIKWKQKTHNIRGHLQQSRADRGLLEYNRDRIYNRYLKWKQKTQAVRNDNQNLNQQVIVLQNNPPVIHNQGMAGYAPKKFRGLPGEDPLLWLQEFRQWCESAGLDAGANARTRTRILGVFETCMEDDARDWWESKIKGKNWELQNILDGVGTATIIAFRALNNAGIGAINANQFRGQARVIRNQAGGDATINGASFIPDETVWDEDWSIAGGRTTDLAPNLPNAGTGGTVVLTGTRCGQAFHEFRTGFPTITAEKSKIAFQGITQGKDGVTRFYSNLRRMVKLAYPALPAVSQDELVRQQFIQGLSRENQIEVRRIGLENPTSVLVKKLEEIERYSTDSMNPLSVMHSLPTAQQAPTLDDIAKLIDSKLQSVKPLPPIIQPQIPAQPAAIKKDIAKERLLYLAYRLGMTREDGDENKVSVDELEEYIDTFLRIGLPDDHIYNQFNFVRKVFGINKPSNRKAYTTKSRHCSECGKSGHTKSSCPKKKKGKKGKKTNYVGNDSSSESSSSSDSSSDDSDDHLCYGLKKNSSKKESVKKKKPQVDKNQIINAVFQLVLKAMVESFVSAVPKDTVISVYNAMNAEFINFKEPILSQLKGAPSIKTREKIWDSVKEILATILQPMISIISNNLASNLIRKDEAEINGDNLHVDNSLWTPAGIGIVNRKSASDVVTIKCRIIAPNSSKSLVIPVVIFDTGSDSSLISSNIAKRLMLDIDKNNAPDLSGVATKSDTMGTVYGLGISIYDSDNDKTIEDDFMVIKSDKDFLLLGVPWIDRAKAIVDFYNRQLSIPISQRKKITIPISLHKRKTNVTSLHIDSIDLKKIHVMANS